MRTPRKSQLFRQDKRRVRKNERRRLRDQKRNSRINVNNSKPSPIARLVFGRPTR